MNRIATVLVILFAGVLGFAGPALAAAGAVVAADAPPDASLIDLAKPILDAIRGGQGWLGAALALIFAVTAARRYGAKRFPQLNSKLGGAVLNVLLSFGGAAATALAAGTAPSLALALTALKVSLAAGLSFEFVKEFVAPLMRALVAKLPAWMQKPAGAALDLILWAFEKRTPVAAAEKAGDDAVAKKPPQGAAAVVDGEELR